MNWHKTNLALIAILLLINIFMAIMLVGAYRDTRLVPKEMIALSHENLASKGIYFKDETIDKEIRYQKVYTFSPAVLLHETEDGEKTRECLVNALSHLSKKSRQTIEEQVQYFEIPEGITASVNEKDGTPIISVMLSGKTSIDKPDLRYIKTGFDYESSAEEIDSINSYQSDMKSISCPVEISNFIKAIYDGEIGISVKSYKKSGSFHTYLCAYTIDGIEISDMSAVFCIQDGTLVYISGDFLFNLPKAEYIARTVDGINILFGIEGIQNDISIQSEHIVYSVFETDGAKNYLVPTWVVNYIEKDNENDGQPKAFIFNALTGKPIVKE